MDILHYSVLDAILCLVQLIAWSDTNVTVTSIIVLPGRVYEIRFIPLRI